MSTIALILYTSWNFHCVNVFIGNIYIFIYLYVDDYEKKEDLICA